LGCWARAWGDGAMAQGVCVVLSTAESEQSGDRGRPQPAAQARRAGAHRARLAGSVGARHRRQPTDGVATTTTLAATGAEGLVRDKTRKPGEAIATETTARVADVHRLPIKPGRCQTMTHDYKRHGTRTLFAALSAFDGRVIGR
jgi:hypothetical protein